jgi:hypothetical protein
MCIIQKYWNCTSLQRRRGFLRSIKIGFVSLTKIHKRQRQRHMILTRHNVSLRLLVNFHHFILHKHGSGLQLRTDCLPTRLKVTDVNSSHKDHSACIKRILFNKAVRKSTSCAIFFWHEYSTGHHVWGRCNEARPWESIKFSNSAEIRKITILIPHSTLLWNVLTSRD